MPDWKKLVRERMASLELPQEFEEDIVTELAAHLDDEYQDGLTHGLDESEASDRALSDIQWKKLARGIRRAIQKENSMNNRMKSLWLPMLVNLAVATGLLVILERLGAHPHVLQVSDMEIAFPIPWLLMLPFSAAAASRMARQAQAPVALQLIAGLAPSLVWLAVFCAMALEFLLDRYQFPSGFPFPLDYFVLSAVGWVVLPAVPLLLGTLPFLRKSEVREA